MFYCYAPYLLSDSLVVWFNGNMITNHKSPSSVKSYYNVILIHYWCLSRDKTHRICLTSMCLLRSIRWDYLTRFQRYIHCKNTELSSYFRRRSICQSQLLREYQSLALLSIMLSYFIQFTVIFNISIGIR